MNFGEITQIEKPETARLYFREPIPEIADAARFLDAAVSAHLAGKTRLVEELILLADIPAIREWTESLWGANSPYIQYRPVANTPPSIKKDQRISNRMPSEEVLKQLLLRDGYHCRFCGIPLIRRDVRDKFDKLYPQLKIWGKTKFDCHAAFQAMWLQYDHVLAHARGGGNEMDNMLITCAPCNYGRVNYTLDEVGLIDPRTREPIRSGWDGLERLLHKPKPISKVILEEDNKEKVQQKKSQTNDSATQTETKEWSLIEYVDFINKYSEPLVSNYLNDLIELFKAAPDLFYIKPGVGKTPSLVIKNNSGKTIFYLSKNNFQLVLLLSSQIELINSLHEKYCGTLKWSLPFETGKWPTLKYLAHLTNDDFRSLKKFISEVACAAKDLKR